MSDLHWAAAVLVTIVSAARITRLITYDAFPPSAWVRSKWDDLTDDSGWNLLFHCPWCMSFWVTLGVFGVGWLTEWHPAWWFVNVVLAASYCAAMVMIRDGDD